MKPPKNIAASIRARLLNLSKERAEDFNYILIRYIQERILYRLSQSRHSDQFVLKGASLFTVWQGAPHRPTKDIDLLGHGTPSPERLLDIFATVLSAREDDNDGLIFATDQLVAEEIREDAVYDGIRITVPVSLGSARTRIQIDVGFGDATVPPPTAVTYPTLLPDLPPPELRAYRHETVVAEKLEAIASLGMANSRMKDYYDIYVILTEFQPDEEILRLAMQATFERRQTPLPTTLPMGLTPAFTEEPAKIAQWRAFVRRAAPEFKLSLADVTSLISETCIRCATHD